MTTIVLTRIAIETVAPLAIYSGERETLGHNAIVRDWNGLPYIPATAIAGVWRHTVRNICGNRVNPIKFLYWFGQSSGDLEERMASRITVTDGLLLDESSCLPGAFSDGRKLRMLTGYNREDRIYSLTDINASGRFERTSCRMNARKAGHKGALFTGKTLPKGLRFAFDVKFELDSEDDLKQYREVLKVIGSRSFALGARTANGQGAFRVIGVDLEEINLESCASDPAKAAEKIRAFAVSRMVRIAKDEELPKLSELIPSDDGTELRTWKFRLSSQGTMRIGTGTPGDISGNVSAVDCFGKPICLMAGEDGSVKSNQQDCFSDVRIQWNGTRFAGEVREFIIPGSTIKGILAHRTMYHFLRRKGWFADSAVRENGQKPQDLINCLLENQAPPPEFEPFYALFGRNDPQNPDNMLSGSLKVHDSVINADSWICRMHNRLDRFTAVVMPSALFGQMRLVNPSFEISISLNPSRAALLPENSEIMLAFNDTLEDLRQGFLNICAGAGRDTAVFSEVKEN